MEEAALHYFKYDFHEDKISDDDEIIYDAIVKSGLLEFEEDYNDVGDDQNYSIIQEITDDTSKPIVLPAVNIKKEICSEDENSFHASDTDSIADKFVTSRSIEPEEHELKCNAIFKRNSNSDKTNCLNIKEEIVSDESTDFKTIEDFNKDDPITVENKTDEIDNSSNIIFKEEVIHIEADIKQEPLDNSSETAEYSIPSPPHIIPECILSEMDSAEVCTDYVSTSSKEPRKKCKNKEVITHKPKRLQNNDIKVWMAHRKLIEIVTPRFSPSTKPTSASVFILSRKGQVIVRHYWFKLGVVNLTGMEISYVCVICNLELDLHSDVLEHGCHKSSKLPLAYECFYCRRIVIISQRHILDHFSGIANYFRTYNHLELHKCSIKACNFSSPSYPCVLLHKKIAHGKLKDIDMDKDMTWTSMNLPSIYMHHSCVYCRLVFSTSSLLKRHYLEVHQSKGIPKFQCDLCPFKSVYLSSLKIHQNFAHQKKIK